MTYKLTDKQFNTIFDLFEKCVSIGELSDKSKMVPMLHSTMDSLLEYMCISLRHPLSRLPDNIVTDPDEKSYHITMMDNEAIRTEMLQYAEVLSSSQELIKLQWSELKEKLRTLDAFAIPIVIVCFIINKYTIHASKLIHYTKFHRHFGQFAMAKDIIKKYNERNST